MTRTVYLDFMVILRSGTIAFAPSIHENTLTEPGVAGFTRNPNITAQCHLRDTPIGTEQHSRMGPHCKHMTLCNKRFNDLYARHFKKPLNAYYS